MKLFVQRSLFFRFPQVLKSTSFLRMQYRTFSAVQPLTIDQVVKNFQDRQYEKSDSAKDSFSMSGVIKSMSEVLKTPLSMEDYQQYAPFADELAFYVQRLVQGQEKQTIMPFQASIMLEFGASFNINNREYWKFVQQSLLNGIETMQCNEILKTLTQMRTQGLLNNQIVVKAITILKEMLPKATPDDLSTFTMIYTSSEVQQALVTRDSNFEDKLEYYLTKQLESKLLTPSDFAMICNSIAYSDLNDQDSQTLRLEQFLNSANSQLQEWVRDNQFSMSELSFVIQAFALTQNIDPQVRSQLFELFEQNILDNCQQLTLEQAVDLFQSMCAHASKELMEVLDRIIGSNIYDLEIADVIPTIKACLASQNTREKFFDVLFSKVKKHMNEFSLNELCELAYLLMYFEDGGYSDLYSLMEPYILSNIHQVNETQLLMLLSGYYNPNLEIRHTILDIIEGNLISRSDSLSFETVTQALYFYAKNRFGEKAVLETLINRLDKESQEDLTQFNPQSIVQALVALNLVGADQGIISRFRESLEKNLNAYSRDELALILEAIPQEAESMEGIRTKISTKLGI